MNRADTGRAPSRHPATPSPATVVTRPAGSTRRIAWFARVGDVDDARGVDRASPDGVLNRAPGADAVGKPLVPPASDRGDVALRVESADRVGLAGIGDVDALRRVPTPAPNGSENDRLEGVAVAAALAAGPGDEPDRGRPPGPGRPAGNSCSKGQKYQMGKATVAGQEEETAENGPIGAERRGHGPPQYARCHLWISGTNRLNRCNVSGSGG